MEIMRNYADSLTEIALIKEQIYLTKKELKYWLGVDLHDESGVPLGGRGAQKFGTNASLYQSSKKIESLKKLENHLEELENSIARMDSLMDRLEGLDYKIAHLRIVEGLMHKDIADRLGYTEQYIRERWSRIKTYKEPTKTT